MIKTLCDFHHWYVDETAKLDGKAWYESAHSVAFNMANMYGLRLPQVCGVLSALSPSVLWETNIHDAEILIRAFINGKLPKDITVSTYGQNKAKCFRILESDGNVFIVEDQFTKGTKTHAFYWNILSPTGTLHVTVDRHATGAALASCGGDHLNLRITQKRYRDISEAYVRASFQLGYASPTTLQATVWVAYRDNFGGRPTVAIQDTLAKAPF